MQGHSFIADVYVLPLETYDLILCIRWLKMLGKIQWDFNDMSMSFM